MRTLNLQEAFIRKSKKTNSLTSNWGTGWHTPAAITLCYIAALITALAHIALFKFLDGRRADGPDELLPQSYINNLSHLLASLFQITLQASLGSAFVQYLWFMLRRKAFRVSTIETLFLIRSKPLSFFKLSALRDTSLLFTIALLIWAIYAATIFPPGALTVGLASHSTTNISTVPTFNASFMGNSSIFDAAQYSLAELTFKLLTEQNFSMILAPVFAPGFSTPRLQHLATHVLSNGVAATIPSPCGTNCSYTTTFIGPYFDCNSSVINVTYNYLGPGDASYKNSPDSTDFIENEVYGPGWVIYNSTCILPSAEGGYLDGNLDGTDSSPGGQVPWYYSFSTESLLATSSPVSQMEKQLVSRKILTCAPAKAEYILYNQYENGAPQTVQSSLVPAQPSSFGPFSNGIELPFASGLGSSIFQAAGPTTDVTAWYTEVNLLNILDAVYGILSGTYTTVALECLGLQNETIPGYGDTRWSVNCFWGDQEILLENPRPLIADSNLNAFFNVVPSPDDTFGPLIDIQITPEILNEMLLNVTLTLIANHGYWNTLANVTTEKFVNIYSFSSPIAIILPYTFSLAIALPFIILGLWALYDNGVPATDGGFIQMITTMGSVELEREASVGCLGGEENIPPKLKDMKIKFGELIDRDFGDNGVVRRAGFGTEEEVVSLKKGARYGRPVRWVRSRDGSVLN